MRRLKICFITDTWFPVYGGGPQVVLNYAKLLSKKYNCRVDIITRNLTGEDNITRTLMNSFKNIKVIKLGVISHWQNIFSRIDFIIRVFFYLVFNKYDIIHAFPFISGLPSFFAGKIKNTPVIFSAFALQMEVSNYRNKLSAFIENLLTFFLPYNLIMSDNQQLTKKKRGIIYLPNGVDINLFDSVNILKSRIPRIIFVGRFHPQKGLDYLLKSLPLLINKFPKLKVVFVGYGQEEEKIRTFIYKYRLTKYIEIKKPLFGKALVKEYKRSHLLVLPSRYEGFGIVVIEAWAAGLPVVVSKVGTLKYIVNDGINGYLVKPGNHYQLAAKITRILKNQYMSKKMGVNGYRLVKEKYNWEKIVQKLYMHYLKLLDY